MQLKAKTRLKIRFFHWDTSGGYGIAQKVCRKDAFIQCGLNFVLFFARDLLTLLSPPGSAPGS